MRDPNSIGGGVDVDYRPRRLFVSLYLRAWRLLGDLTGMVQGAAQFCRQSDFEQVSGYDETAWIGEDVDFYWSLERLARESRRTVRLIRDSRVRPSCRRFDKWPLWKILLWTNPVFIVLFRRRKPGGRVGTRILCGRADIPRAASVPGARGGRMSRRMVGNPLMQTVVYAVQGAYSE